MIREARFYEVKGEGDVVCLLCPNKCFIKNGKRGSCGVRENREGTLYTLIYGSVSSMAVDPIEKKPLFHFWPGSDIFSIATVGCNLHCMHCQNWHISQVSIESGLTRDILPEEIIKAVEESGSKSIAYTYNEPFIWYEYVYDVAKLAHKKGILNVLVTNGYILEEPLREIAPYIDAANVDVKAMRDEFYKKICKVSSVKPVLETVVIMKELGIHVELTYLVIPTLNDDEDEIRKFVRWVKEDVDSDTPVHFSRFYPHYKLSELPPTPVSTIMKAQKIALDEGLHYVYAGNVPGYGEDTYCPRCGEKVVERYGFTVRKCNLRGGKCPKCGETIAIVGECKETVW
nr:AmmeMemoRadiSam system radical SAM enzyme [Candidatus Freyrarchaeum guaymaensis]